MVCLRYLVGYLAHWRLQLQKQVADASEDPAVKPQDLIEMNKQLVCQLRRFACDLICSLTEQSRLEIAASSVQSIIKTRQVGLQTLSFPTTTACSRVVAISAVVMAACPT